MAKLIGPCLSLEASGSVGGTLTFQNAIKSKTCRMLPRHKLSRSVAQLIIRDNMSWFVSVWHSLSDYAKNEWNSFTDGYGLTGYHAFMKQFATRTYRGLYQFNLPPDIGFCLVGEHLVAEFYAGGAYISAP